MAVRFDAAGDELNRTANVPSNSAFTYMLWSVIDNDRGTGNYQPFLFALDAGSTSGYSCGLISDQFDVEVHTTGGTTSSMTGSRPAAGTPACVFLRSSGTGAGQLTGGYRAVNQNAFTTSANTLGGINQATTLYFGGVFSTYWSDGRKWNIKIWDRALSDAEILAESYYFRPQFPASLNLWLPLHNANDVADRSGNGRNPTVAGTLTAGDSAGQLWKPSRKILLPRAVAGIAGSLAALESGADVAALSGVVLVQGVLSVAETGRDTASILGAVPASGALAVTEAGSDSAAVAGAVSVSGSLSAAEVGSDTALIVGGQVATGDLVAVEVGSDTAAAPGVVLVRGALAALEAGSDTAAVGGAVVVQGAMSVSETGSDAFAASGSLSGAINGIVGATEIGADTMASTGVVLVAGAMVAAEASSDSADMVGAVPVVGLLAASEVGSDTALILGDGVEPEPEPGRLGGFVLVDFESPRWWKRKPRALPAPVAEKRVKKVAKAIDEIATEKIKHDEPIRQKDVRAELAPLLAEMPGFDWRPVFRAVVEFRQAEAAREQATAEIERIRAIERDDDDVMVLLMSF